MNLGMNASGPFEVHMAVNEFFKHTFAKQIFVQVDYTYYTAAPDSIGQLVWLPYLKEKDIFESFKPYGKVFLGFKNIPMYRYLQFEGSLGFRNVAVSLLGKSPDFLAEGGFKSRAGMLQQDTPYPYTLLQAKNKHIAEIITSSKRETSSIIFFTAPIYKPEEGFSTFEANLPNYKNMSTAVTNKNYFSDHMHVNNAGASLFTEKFIETFFYNASKNW